MERKTVHSLKLRKDSEVEYYLYLPEGELENKKVVASIHGLSRNADSHMNLNVPYAKEKDAILVVPYFTREHFDGYNCLGIESDQKRADKAFNEILEEVSEMTGASTDRIYLAGYSAGAQFVHRYAMIYPEKIERLAVEAAGFYTMPNSDLAFPDGIETGGIENLPSVDLKKFLKIPTCMFVGEEDVLRTPNLRQDEFVDSTQGMNRVERGRKWIETVGKMARKNNYETEYVFDTIAKSGHSFEICMENGLGDKVWDFLYK